MTPLALLASSLPLAAAVASSSRHRELARKLQTRQAPAGQFEVVGDSGVSAQMMFLGTENTVFILDKAENNSMTITTNGTTHPAWGTWYDLASNTATQMEVTSNTFCACGAYMADGRMAVFGGNQPVTYGGAAVDDTGANPTGANPYDDGDGGAAIRVLSPCDGGACNWQEGGDSLTMYAKRWYPTVEPLGDGSLVIFGGDHNGGYVSTFAQNEPSYEFFPKQSTGAIPLSFLNDTVPVNLFPLSWLMPDGTMFMQAAYRTILYDFDTKTQTELAAMPYAVRVYPASAATAMLPLTPANNYEPTIIFCGGSAAPFNKSSDGGAGFNVTAVQADDSCVRITPMDTDPEYEDDDSLPEPRSMGNFVYLPTGELWLGNGVGMGTAGYGTEKYSTGQSYGQAPVYEPVIYNPNAPAGSRFNRTGLSASPHERMYHSTAILLADGSLLVSGSNPNADVSFVQWGTSYVVEKWYPLWYNEVRPQPSGFPSSLSYGGSAWNLTYTPANSDSNPANTKITVVRTGFSTHAINFGQRYLELNCTYSQDESSGEVTMFVSQMPPNANIFQPGPAMIFLVVDGIPSEGQMITIGSGSIETQTLLDVAELPQSQVVVAPQANSTTTSASSDSTATTAQDSKSAAGFAFSSISPAVLTVTALLALALGR